MNLIRKSPAGALPGGAFRWLAAVTLLSRESKLAADRRERPYLYGVPGPVRTANLPLRRGMLYPIELLGQMTTIRPRGQRRTACMLTAEAGFVMSSVGFLIVGRSPQRHTARQPAVLAVYAIVQIALPQNATVANCNSKSRLLHLNILILLT